MPHHCSVPRGSSGFGPHCVSSFIFFLPLLSWSCWPLCCSLTMWASAHTSTFYTCCSLLEILFPSCLTLFSQLLQVLFRCQLLSKPFPVTLIRQPPPVLSLTLSIPFSRFTFSSKHLSVCYCVSCLLGMNFVCFLLCL